MSNLKVISYYRKEIETLKSKLASQQKDFDNKEYLKCKKYPQHMHLELLPKYINSTKEALEENERLLALELSTN